MFNTLVFIWSIVLLLAISSVAGLLWAISAGQFCELTKSAESIFDEEESIGKTTDRFPQEKAK